MSIYPDWCEKCERVLSQEREQLQTIEKFIAEFRGLLLLTQLYDRMQSMANYHRAVIAVIEYHIELIDSGDVDAVDIDAERMCHLVIGGNNHDD